MNAEEYLKSGDNKIRKGDFSGAITDYSKAIKLNPKLAVVYGNRGAARAGKGDLDGAIIDFDKAIELDPEHVYAYSNRGKARAGKGNLDGAVEDFGMAIRLYAKSANFYCKRGDTKASKGDLDGAIADFGIVLGFNSDLTNSFSNLLNARIRKGDRDGAIADFFGMANQLNDWFAQIYRNRGNVRVRKGDTDGAIADYDKAIQLYPMLEWAYTDRGYARHVNGDIEGAIADHSKAIEINPGFAEAYSNRGNAKNANGDPEGAFTDCNKAIKLKPNLADAYNNRGIARQKDDLDGAIKDYNKAIEINPKHVGAYNNRGNAKSDKNDLEGAIEDYSKAIELSPKLAVSYNNRGLARQKDDLDGAIKDYNKAIELSPKLAAPYGNRGNAKRDKNDLEGAIEDYSKGIELGGDAAFFASRGLTKWDQGNQDGSIKDFCQANKYAPELAYQTIQIYLASITAKWLPDNRKQIFQFWNAIKNLQNVVCEVVSNYTNINPMHYTNFGTLRNLMEKEQFRLYNSSNMADKKEGNVFFDLLGLEERQQTNLVDDVNHNQSHNAYIGSFVMGSNNEDEYMWDEYGKDNGTKGAGFALVFYREKFAERAVVAPIHFGKPIISSDRTRFSRSAKFHDVLAPNEPVDIKQCCLYYVSYVGQNAPKINEKIKEALKKLGRTLKDPKLEELYEAEENAKRLVCELLDLVRYLFKDEIYQREHEVRLVIWRSPESSIIKSDSSGKRYIECPSELFPYEIIQGPNAKVDKNLHDWCKKQNIRLK